MSSSVTIPGSSIAFHLSTQMHQLRAFGKRYDFSWLEDRLLPLGFRLIFCTRSAGSFESAREERLKVSGNPKQYVNLEAFISEQKVMKELVAASRMPQLTVDISDNNVSRVVEEIADWLEGTGGLYM